MEFTDLSINNIIVTFFMIFSRIAGFIMSAPAIGSKVVIKRIKLLIALIISFMILPVHETLKLNVFSFETILIMGQQILIGIIIGMVFQFLFQVFFVLGEIISLQAGLGFAILNDPATGENVPAVSQLYVLLITYLFFFFDGHLVFFRILHDSFTIVPIGLLKINNEIFKSMAEFGNWILANGLKIAIPSVTALLIVQCALGVMTKSAQQLNIFSIGFPITMLLGIIIIWLNMKIIPSHFEELFNYISDLIKNEIMPGVLNGRK